NWATQTWLDTGVAVDDRSASRADALWDGQKLYIASHMFADNSGQTAPSGQRGELYRYSYNAGAKNYSLDGGYPVEVTLGKSETLVLDKDSTGRLWVTYVESQKVMVNHSLAADDQWGTPYILPVADATALTSDDIASLIAFNGRIGVMWSNHTTQKMYFATHQDNALDSVWQSVSIYAPGGAAADDHINLKSLQTDNAGSIFAVLKTSFSTATSPLINLLVCASGTSCTTASNWQPYVVYKKQDHHTRAILLIDTTNRMLNIFSTSAESGGTIYRKSTAIDNIQFAAGHGTPFIQSTTDTTINNATSTKQNVNSTTGLVVLASDVNSHYYLHNYLSLTTPAGGTVQFNNTAHSVKENGGTATITVTLNTPSESVVTVNYATSDGTATQPGDYTATSGTLTFNPGITTKTFQVPVINNLVIGGNKTVNLTLSASSGASLGTPSTAILTIVDDDSPPTAQFSLTNYNVAENVAGGNATITVILNKASATPLSVNYATSNGTATAGSDYTAASGTLTFPANVTSQSFTVAIINDTTFEPNETVNLTLSNPNPNTVALGAPAVLTIVNDDLQPKVQFSAPTYSTAEGGTATINVTLSNPSVSAITVNYATSDSTASSADYTAASGTLTFTPGETSKTFTVATITDSLSEADEAVNLTLSNPTNATFAPGGDSATLTIVDASTAPTIQFSSATYSVNENVGSGVATITVTLSAASAQPVEVGITTSDGTATASDYAAVDDFLTIDAGLTSGTFEVPITNDNAVEGDETVNLTLSNPSNAVLGTAAAVLTIVDDETVQPVLPTVQFSAASYSVGENGGTATVTAILSAASSSPVTVNYATRNGTATVNSDYAAANGALTFAPGETSKTFAVAIMDDLIDENNETVELTLNAPNNALLGTPAVATLTITDNDNPPTVQFSATAYQASETSGTASIAVTLQAASGLTVTVHYASSNSSALAGSDYQAVNGDLTFNPGETNKTFTVTLVADSLVESSETVHLALSNPSHASLGVPSSAVLTILDANSTPPAPVVQFSAATYLVNEQAGVVTVTVTLNTATNVPVTVNYATSNGMASADSDYTATSGTLTFQPGQMSQSFTIPITDDLLDESDETINLLLSDANQATLGANQSASVTILDNDAPPTIQFNAAVYQVTEESPSVRVEVKLSAASGLTITVNYVINQVTASAGATTGILIFSPGEISKTFDVEFIPTGSTGPATDITVVLAQPSNASLGTVTTTTLTVVPEGSAKVYLPFVQKTR
ncbi:MAG: hypothetical protein NT075_28415, partial [Chloroflexi bacterium]|nr:hypothetical protein [Chloroflexota bacterium]